MRSRVFLAVAACVLVPATAAPQAMGNLTSLRVQYNTRKVTVAPQGALKAEIDEIDRQLAEATRLGQNGEFRGLGDPPADPTTRRSQELSELDVMQVLQLVRQQYRVDESRVYLSGHSMGGIGTWKIAAKNPDVWAAIAPFAGRGTPSTRDRMRNIPEIVVHGDADPTVPVEGSRSMVAKAKELGIDAHRKRIRSTTRQ